MNPRPLVIIGGMGPQASVRFHQLLLTASEPYHSGAGDEYPAIVHFSLPVRDFISDTSHQSAAVQQLKELTPYLNRLEPTCITLACNTAHLLVPSIGYLLQPRFLSLIDSVSDVVAESGFNWIGLLASPVTIQSQLYARALERRGIGCITPATTELPALEQIIRRVIAMQHTAADQAALRRIAEQLTKQGAEALILGCTELPLACEGLQLDVPVFDCLDIYAKAAVARYYLYNGEQHEY